MDVNSKEPNIINWNNSAAEIEDPGTGGGTNHDIHVGARFFPDIVKLNNEQWQALIALHRALPYDCHAFFLASQHLFACPTLLHEHHPFFLAFQHRYACSSPLKRVDKNAMPAGMWRRGIDSFLRLFKFSILRLFHCMLTFIYLVWNRISRPWLYPMARNKGLLLKGLHYNPATLVRWWWAEEDYEAVANVLTFRSETPRPKSTKSQRWKGFGAIVLEISLLVWQITSGFWWVSNQLILALCRCFQRSVRRHAFCFIPFLVSVASASVRTNSVDCTPETGQPMAPGYQGDNSGLSWPWYPVIVAGILVVEFAAVHILHQPLLFHGASMGISAGAFLLMAFNDEVPFRLQFRYVVVWAVFYPPKGGHTPQPA
jgi:hypothetical protein